MSFTIDMDSLWIKYYSLIISTIFYIIYLKFTYFAKQSSKSLKSLKSPQHHQTNVNSTDIINDNTVNTKTSILNHIQTDNINESEISTEITNPNIDEMISSLNHKIQSIAPIVPKYNHNNNQQHLANIHHKHQQQPSKYHETYTNHIEITQTITAIHQSNHIIDSLDDIDSDDSFISSPSPHSKIIAPQPLITAHDELFALSKKMKLPLSNDNNIATDSPSTYYDTLVFDDESEYDSDTLNDYDNMNKQLREDMKQTLFRINPLHHSISGTQETPKMSTSCSSHSLFNYPSRTVSMSSLDVIQAPNQVITALNQLSQDKLLRVNTGERSQSNSPLNMQRYGFSSISGESGSEFDHDKYIQENDFLLNEEWSSSDLNHRNEEEITHHIMTPITRKISQCKVDQDEDFENDLKNCDVDLSQFPTEQECYPLH